MIAGLGIHDLGLFLLTGLVLNLTPGADTLLVVNRSAAGGWRQGAAAAFGIQLGCLVHASAAALGVAALLAASTAAFRALTWIGAAYLAWLGVQMLRQSWRPGASLPSPVRPVSLRGDFLQGLLTNVLNPKVGLFFLAFVPQFIRADAASPLAAFLTLGVFFDLTGGAWLLLVAALTVRLRGAVAPWTGRLLNGIGGTLFIGLAGAWPLTEKEPDMQVLIIGASRGIGLEFVRQYREEGHRVTATARDEAGLERLRALGAEAFQLDVTDAASVAGLAGKLDGTAFDTLVVNAGVYGPRSGALEVPTEPEFDEVMHTNVLGPMRVLAQLGEAFAPGARLAVLSSRMASMSLRDASYGWVYRASKAALNSVLKDTSIEFAGKAICIAFHPGWVRTDMGGSGADLPVPQSVGDMRRTLAGLSATDNGAFINHDGKPLTW